MNGTGKSLEPMCVERRRVMLAVLAAAGLSACMNGIDEVYAHVCRAREGGPPSPPLRASGPLIVDANGHEVVLRGLAWSGMEGSTYIPDGLWRRNWRDLLGLLPQLGFDTLRLGFSNAIFATGAKPSGFDRRLNADLIGLSPLEIMDKIVDEAGRLGLLVLLSRHRPGIANDLPELWYTGAVSERRWIADWLRLARRYRDKRWVIGADIANEPHGRATWGSGHRATDWRLAAERAGSAILEEAPNWLIIVQGIGSGSSWWGGDLTGVERHPVRLPPANLVYSTHVFGPEVYSQKRFFAGDFPANLPAFWDRQFGYLFKQAKNPVIIGSFGVRAVSPNSRSGKWFREIVSYIHNNQISFVYWALNPNSDDTGGILENNWRDVQIDKIEALFGGC